eukprot:CAMPEP_0201883276 /NCGR_PEP_ID=MMETSP0902-20130614/15283_1 /ASSEMBLY_ACC=CAM_ASM_000551 /TAXON_ID=420261 /ORGANISM="Thalassiosira antarctica, Strain CCMP982" /LENGTH=126 /DNA_ID=CAMNT_0048412023 /DNA_START=111 /DNA_END=491 /DNA_ORIENTATION=+
MISASIFRAARLSRPLSTTCTRSLGRLNDILENYRASHYSQELPKRFRKDIVKAASKRSSPLLPSPGIISAEGIENVLNNIGAGDQMSHDEIETILREVCGSGIGGTEKCVISADQMMDLISNRTL